MKKLPDEIDLHSKQVSSFRIVDVLVAKLADYQIDIMRRKKYQIDENHLFEWKSEMLYSRIGLLHVKKTYFGNVVCVEGNPANYRDMKNMDKSSFSAESKKFNNQLIDVIMDESVERMNYSDVLDSIIFFRKNIKDNLLQGELGAGTPAKFRHAAHYDEPYAYHGNIAGEVFNLLFGVRNETKLVDGERQEIFKLLTPTVGKNDDPNDYINFVKSKTSVEFGAFLDEALEDDNFREWIFKAGLKYIGIPIVEGKIPAEIIPLLDLNLIVEENTTNRGKRLFELLGIDYVATSARMRVSNIVKF